MALWALSTRTPRWPPPCWVKGRCSGTGRNSGRPALLERGRSSQAWQADTSCKHQKPRADHRARKPSPRQSGAAGPEEDRRGDRLRMPTAHSHQTGLLPVPGWAPLSPMPTPPCSLAALLHTHLHRLATNSPLSGFTSVCIKRTATLIRSRNTRFCPGQCACPLFRQAGPFTVLVLGV